MLEPGYALGNYVVEGDIGGGGMARVVRVRHAVLGTLHALKVLAPAYREQPEVRERFLAEGRIAARLQHPNIVRVTDTVSTPEVAGLVMELVDGPTLEQHIASLGRRATLDEVRAIFTPVLAAVGHAHRNGVIHRDIKPSNILLDSGSGAIVPKVTDFGIAKVTEAGQDLVRKKGVTSHDARMGTLAYMSPEQIKAARDVTARSDIFSLGATLFELATGRVAFAGDSEYAIMKNIVEGAYDRSVVDLDPAIAAVVKRALEVDPEKRFATCEEFAAALSTSQPASVAPSTPAPTRPAAVSVHDSANAIGPMKPPTSPAPRHVLAQPQAIDVSVPPRKSGALVSLLVVGACAVLGVVGVAAYNHAREPAADPDTPAPASPSVAPVTPTFQRQQRNGAQPFEGCADKPGREPAIAIVAYVTPEQRFDDFAKWFPGVPLSAVQAIAGVTRRKGEPRVALAIDKSAWPRWQEVASGLSGTDVCWAIGGLLADLDVGEPNHIKDRKRGRKYEYDITDEKGLDHAFVKWQVIGPLSSSLPTIQEFLGPTAAPSEIAPGGGEENEAE